MSQSAVLEPVESQKRPPAANDPYAGSEHELTPEAQAALVARARDLISGRVKPPVMPIPPVVEEFLKRELAKFPERPTPEFLRDLTEHLCIQAHYRGQPIATIGPEGSRIILAVGEHEIRALFRGLPGDERNRAQIAIRDTD